MTEKANKKKSQNFLVYFLIIILTGAVSGLLSGFNVFQNIDYRIYDFMTQFKKNPEKDERIVMVKIDDPSIEELGEFPWSRDIIADVLIRLRELNSYIAIFDIEYISPSKMGIAPSATEKISDGVDSVEYTIDDSIDAVCNAINNGYYRLDEIPELMNQMEYDVINPQIDSLHDYIVNESFRDNDEYFGKALQFFGNASLTVNIQDLKNKYEPENIDYIHKRFLLHDIKDPDNLISKNNSDAAKFMDYDELGFSPAMFKLINRANGVGFTNSFIDKDGERRRMETFYRYGDDYLCQLAFGPYLKIVDSNDIVKQRRSIIVRNANIDGVRKDVKIPTDNNGAVLVNYRKGSLDDTFNSESVINILLLDTSEENMVKYMKELYNVNISDEDGYQMDFTTHVAMLLNDYLEISEMKEDLLSKCTGFDENNVPYDGITQEEYDNYFALRRQFFKNAGDFIDANYMDTVNQRLEELTSLFDEEQIEIARNNIQSIFDDIKAEYDFYTENFSLLSKKFNNSYCILGNTATSTTDLGATPLNKKYENVGIHASVLNTLLEQNYIYYVDWYYWFAFAFAVGLILILFRKKSNTFLNCLGGIVVLFIIVIPFVLFIQKLIYIPSFGIIFFVVLNYFGGIIYRFLESSKEKRFITQVAASFANKDTVEQLRKNPELFKTEGIKKHITALFTDIQKFSTFSESITKIYGEEGANKLILHLNDYLGAMSNEILVNGGNIDKYEGDAIISMFGAPDPTNLHNKEEWAYLTLDSAIRMKKIEKEFNDSHKDLFKTYEVKKDDGSVENITLNPFKTRIGINSGDAFVGLMGSQTSTFNKLNYTMIGDTVNLAARLEGVNKAYASWILCSDSTWNLANSGANEGKITAKRLDQVRVVGRSTPVQLYNIIGFTDELSSIQREEIDVFHSALDRYLKREFVQAGKMFLQASSMIGEDPTALIFANRCKDFIENGIPEDWDGVINMTSK